MNKKSVTLAIAGRQIRVSTTGTEEELHSLAAEVDERIQEITRGRAITIEAAMLVALSFAHDLRAARSEQAASDINIKAKLVALASRIDSALADTSEEG